MCRSRIKCGMTYCYEPIPGQARNDVGNHVIPYLIRNLLSNEFYRLFDERMHVGIVLDERNDLAVSGENLLNAP